jgi:hypothetical protein
VEIQNGLFHELQVEFGRKGKLKLRYLQKHMEKRSQIKKIKQKGFSKLLSQPGAVAHACNPSYLGIQEDHSLKPAWANSF